MTRVKICGITRLEDALVAAHAGADAIGLICHPPSNRVVSPALAAKITARLPAFITPVLVFVNADRNMIESYRKVVPQALLQFHGHEEASFCSSFNVPYIKSCSPATTATEIMGAHPTARAILCDAVHGGSGTAFDWHTLPPPTKRKLPLVLAGGLNTTNVAAAIAQVQPYAVDASSGVCTPDNVRHKDPSLIKSFVRIAKGIS